MQIYSEDRVDRLDPSLLEEVKKVDNALSELTNRILEDFQIGHFESSDNFILFEDFDAQNITYAIELLSAEKQAFFTPFIQTLSLIETKLKLEVLVDQLSNEYGGNEHLPTAREIIKLNSVIPSYIERKEEFFRVMLSDLVLLYNLIDDNEPVDEVDSFINIDSDHLYEYFYDVKSLFEVCKKLERLTNGELQNLTNDRFKAHGIELYHIIDKLPSIRNVISGTFIGNLIETSTTFNSLEESKSRPKLNIIKEDD